MLLNTKYQYVMKMLYIFMFTNMIPNTKKCVFRCTHYSRELVQEQENWNYLLECTTLMRGMYFQTLNLFPF